MGEWVDLSAEFSLDWPFSEKYLRKLFGKTDVEDALQRVERLSNDEARAATVQVLEATDSMDNKMEQVVDGAQRVNQLVYR
jgi:hypothetical protein